MNRNKYSSTRKVISLPRVPLEGNIDLTYRCNNNCLHCWTWLHSDAPEKSQELSLDEIRNVAEEARSLGCRRWNISGGEPMLRPDFLDIFDLLTSRSTSYTLNTNGTLITPAIAKMLKRKGNKLVALYGATPEIYEAVTRNPGGFEQTMQGFAYLREANAGFTVQLVPMRANWHQWEAMLALAKSLSPDWRVGAPWLWLSSSGSRKRNAEIAAQRLDPDEVIKLDPPNLSFEERMATVRAGCNTPANKCVCVKGMNDQLLSQCDMRHDFHIDPYGSMSYCSLIKDPALRYDLRQGKFSDAWEEFIPSLIDKVRDGEEYLNNCGSCHRRDQCRWCVGYGYLETGRHSARVPYLCAVAEGKEKFKQQWMQKHRRYFRIAGITVQVESDIPMTRKTFNQKFDQFEVEELGPDSIFIRHHFGLPKLNGQDLGVEAYRQAPWAIHRKGDNWIYLGISNRPGDSTLHRVAVFDDDYTHTVIYSPDDALFRKGNLQSLSMLPTDQILLGRVLANRKGCVLHSSGVILNNRGLLFVGHSGAGKSTIIKMLGECSEVLCDDRIVVRQWEDGFRIHGTWSHGEIPTVSCGSGPLSGIFILKKSQQNRIIKAQNKREILTTLLSCLIKPAVCSGWWGRMFEIMSSMINEIPCYNLEFDRSGEIVRVLQRLTE